LFVATVNNTTNISTAVLDRLEVIQMPSYTDEEKETIAKDYLFPKIKQQAGISELKLTVDEAIWPIIIRPLGYDSGTRGLERTLETMARRLSRKIVEGKLAKNGSFVVNEQNIKEFLPS
jgi:ATP-dependent Lon protease